MKYRLNLSFLFELQDAFHYRHLQEYVVTYLKLQVFTPYVDITLMPTLNCAYSYLDLLNDLCFLLEHHVDKNMNEIKYSMKGKVH